MTCTDSPRIRRLFPLAFMSSLPAYFSRTVLDLAQMRFFDPAQPWTMISPAPHSAEHFAHFRRVLPEPMLVAYMPTGHGSFECEPQTASLVAVPSTLSNSEHFVTGEHSLFEIYIDPIEFAAGALLPM